MQIKIVKLGNTEEVLLKGDYEYCEGESRQEKKPAFFIALNNKSGNYEIHFYAGEESEFERFIKDVQEIKNNFEKK